MKKILEKPYLFFLIAAIIVLIFLGTSDILEGKEFNWHDIKVEAHGLLFDLFVFGVLLSFYEYLKKKKEEAEKVEKEKKERIERYLEELHDYSNWDDSEAYGRIAGILKRLSNEGYSKIPLSQHYIRNRSIKDIKIENSRIDKTSIDFCSITNSSFEKSTINNSIFTNSRFINVKFNESKFIRFSTFAIKEELISIGEEFGFFNGFLSLHYDRLIKHLNQNNYNSSSLPAPLLSYHNCLFIEGSFNYSYLISVGFSKSDFTLTDFKNVIIKDCYFIQANFSNTEFNHIIFEDVYFVECNFENIDLSKSHFKSVTFENCKLNSDSIPSNYKKEVTIT